MDSANPTAANNALVGVDGGARPASPSHSVGTLAPGENWEDDFDNFSDNVAMVNEDPFMGASAYKGPSSESLYPDLAVIQELSPGAWRYDPAPHPWSSEFQGADARIGDPSATAGGQAALPIGGRVSPQTPALNTMSWPLLPRTNKATPERLYKLKVQTVKFEQHQPVGERPCVVNPANRLLTNEAELAKAIANGAGPDYMTWCAQTVSARPNQWLDDGDGLWTSLARSKRIPGHSEHSYAKHPTGGPIGGPKGRTDAVLQTFVQASI